MTDPLPESVPDSPPETQIVRTGPAEPQLPTVLARLADIPGLMKH